MKNNITESEFVQLYQSERPIYDAWGKYICNYIKDELNKKYTNVDRILKMPITYRTKDIESLVEKAFYRNKKYDNPYANITDKVGVRIVVMTEMQIQYIKKIVENCSSWTFSNDVDYHVLRETNPDVFAYQSIHYIVRNKEDIVFDGYSIPAGTPCEMQIRTLEQHAYAEISHDLVYKKEKDVNGKVLRLLARTAAFNEESDFLFGEMYNLMYDKETNYNNFTQKLMDYRHCSMDSDKLNRVIYDDIFPIIEKYNISSDTVIEYIEQNKFILQDIDRQENNVLFKQPIIIVLYYLISKYRYELDDVWGFPQDMLTPIKTDLGISTD